MPEYSVSFRFDYIKDGLPDLYEITYEYSFGKESPKRQKASLYPGHTTAVNIYCTAVVDLDPKTKDPASKMFILKFKHDTRGEEKIEIDMLKYIPAKKETQTRDLKVMSGMFTGKKLFFFVDVSSSKGGSRASILKKNPTIELTQDQMLMIEEARSDLANAVHENGILIYKYHEQIQSMKNQSTEYAEKIKQLNSQVIQEKKERAAALEKLFPLEDEVKQLRSKVEELQVELAEKGDAKDLLSMLENNGNDLKKEDGIQAVALPDDEIEPVAVDLPDDGDGIVAVPLDDPDMPSDVELRMEIEDLKVDKSKLQVQIDEYTKQISKLMHDISEASAKASAATTITAKLEEELNTRDNEAKLVRAQLSSTEADLKKKNVTLAAKESEIADCLTKMKNLEEKVKELQSKEELHNANAVEELDSLRLQVDTTQALLEQAEEEKNSATQQVKQLKSQIEELRAELTRATETLTLREQALNEARTQHEQQLKQTIDQYQAQIKLLNQDGGNAAVLDQLNSDNAKLTADYNKAIAEKKKIEDEYNTFKLESQSKLSLGGEWKQKYDKVEEELAKLQTQVTRANSERDKLAAEKKSAEDKLDKIVKSMESLKNEREGSSKDLDSISSQLRSEALKVKHLEQERDELLVHKQERENLEVKLREKQRELSRKDSELLEKKVTLERINSEREKMITELNALRKRVDNEQKSLETDIKIRDLEMRLKIAEAEKKRIDEECKRLNLQLKFNQGNVDEESLLKAADVQVNNDPITILRHSVIRILAVFETRIKSDVKPDLSEIGNTAHNSALFTLVHADLINSLVAIFNYDFEGPFFLFTTPNYWHMFAEIEQAGKDTNQLIDKQFSATMNEVNNYYNSWVATHRNITLPYPEHEFKLRTWIALCLNNQNLHELLRYMCRKHHQIRRYYVSSALLRSAETVEKKIVKYLACIGKLPFAVDLDGHYHYYLVQQQAAAAPSTPTQQ